MRELRPLAEQGHGAAVKWYRKAAERGYTLAQASLGVLYDNGLGVLQNYAEAAKWFRKAAEQGEASAHRNLGRMYEHDRGVSKDYVQAHKWYNLAAAHGNKEAARSRDKVAGKMTPDQIAEAQRLAREWMEKHGKGE